MKKLLLAGIAGATALAAAAPAQANPTWHYRGGCGFFTISDGTETSQTKWDGEIHIAAIATTHPNDVPDPTASITVECELRVNGVSIGIYASASGTGGAFGGGQLSFNAHPDDIVTVCEQVTVNTDFHKDCGDSTTTPIVPDPVRQAYEDHVEPTILWIDEEICKLIRQQDGGPADQPPTFDIRSDGDIYIDGEWFWDCPPYETSGT